MNSGGSLVLEPRVYQGKNIKFILLDRKIIVKTQLQSFVLNPTNHYWTRRLNLVRIMIEMGQIETLQELAEFCSFNIEWRITSVRYDY